MHRVVGSTIGRHHLRCTRWCWHKHWTQWAGSSGSYCAWISPSSRWSNDWYQFIKTWWEWLDCGAWLLYEQTDNDEASWIALFFYVSCTSMFLYTWANAEYRQQTCRYLWMTGTSSHPARYLKFMDVFSKRKTEMLPMYHPINHAVDCAIDLEV